MDYTHEKGFGKSVIDVENTFRKTIIIVTKN